MAKRLADTLPTLPAPGDDPTARQLRAGLWERFAESKRKKDPEEAIAALERALELDPDRISTRVALAALYGQHVQFADVALTNLRRIVNAEPGRVESLQALGGTFVNRGQLHAARCVYEVLDLIGDPDGGVKDFLRDHPVPALKAEDPYAAILEEADRTAMAGREAMVMAEVFTLLWEGAPHLLNERLDDLGVTAEDRVSPISDLDLARVYGQVAKTLGNKKTVFYVKRNATMQQPEIVVQTPPALVVGSEMLSAPLGQVRFELARGLELTRPEYILAAGVRPKQFTQLFGMVLRAFHPRHTKRRSSGPDDAMEQATAFRKSVPYKVSKRLVELFNEMGTVSWSSVGWRKVVSDVGNRTGLLLSGDLRAAVASVLRGSRVLDDASPSELRELIAAHEPLAELIRFALSDDYFRLREKLGTAAARAAAA